MHLHLRKNTGPGTLPCGTPILTPTILASVILTDTFRHLLRPPAVVAGNGSRSLHTVALATRHVDGKEVVTLARSAVDYICHVGSVIRERWQDAVAFIWSGKKQGFRLCSPTNDDSFSKKYPLIVAKDIHSSDNSTVFIVLCF